MFKNNQNNYLLQYRDLLNQYIVDMYAKIETERLIYMQTHQKELRVDNYDHLKDTIDTEGNIKRLGKIVILPSTFIGGNRFFQQKTQDAMIYVRKYGTPDLFITFTCKKWTEITNELINGQKSNHRNEIIAKNFNLKLKKLIKLLINGQVFGQVMCRIR